MDGIPTRTRMSVIEHNSFVAVGIEDGPFRDVDTGKYTEKPFRGVPKKD